jgi:glycosyltransferase involved in cell wall biosynthesis/ribosomal protein S18 acetylase RimI-like enzyme
MPVEIRSATNADLTDLVRLHRVAFPDAFMTHLGPRFLDSYYSVATASDDIIVLAATLDGVVVGSAVAYSPGISIGIKQLLARSGWRTAAGILLRACRTRTGRRGIADNLRPSVRSHSSRCGDSFYFASMAVDPAAQGNGIGGSFLDELLGQTQSLSPWWDVDVVDDETAPVYRLHVRRGFRPVQSYRRLNGERRVTMRRTTDKPRDMPRILAFTNYLSPEKSDGTLVNELLDELTARGHEVLVYAQDWLGRVDRTSDRRVGSMRVLWNQPVERGGAASLLRRWLLTPVVGWRRYGATMQGFEADWIISFQPAVLFSSPIRKLVRTGGSRSLFVHWDFFPYHDAEMGTLKPAFVGKIAALAESRLINRFDVVGHMTDECTRYFDAHFKCPKPERVVVPLWGALGRTLPPDDRLAIRAELGLDEPTVAVIFGGQLSAGRGFENIFELAARAKTTCPNVKILIVGGGKAQAEIEQQLARAELSNIRLLPRRQRVDYQRLVAACDIGIVSTSGEVSVPTFPHKTLEYMCNAVPVLASVEASEGFRDVVQVRARGGLVSIAGDHDAFLANLVALANSKELRLELGGNGKRYFEKHMAVGMVAQQIEQLLNGRTTHDPSESAHRVGTIQPEGPQA